MKQNHLEHKFAIIYEVIEHHLGKFQLFDLQLLDTQLIESLIVGKYIAFLFRKKTLDLTLRITFLEAKEGRNGGFNVMITSSKNEKLQVEDYLRLHDREDLLNHFTYHDPQINIRDFTDAFIKMLLGLFGNELKPIIDGTSFEETPIDWMGYK